MSRPTIHLSFLAAIAALLIATPSYGQLRNAQDHTLMANDGTAFLVTRGTVRVPELRSARDTTRYIDLAVVRVRRNGQAAGAANAILAGGPGASGVDEVLNLAKQGGAAWSDLVGGDVVGMDQRGTGASSPSLASEVRYNLPQDRAGSPEAWLPLIREKSREEAKRIKGLGINLRAYNTEESADDVEAVRQALGYGKMIVWGRSYGSHLALATLRRHPQGVERVILVSPEGPDHTWKSPAEADRVLSLIAERAAAPDMIQNMRKVLVDLAHQPASVDVLDPSTGHRTEVVIGPFDIQVVVAQASGDPRALAGLPAALRLMAAGNYQSMGPLVLATRSTMGVQSAMKQAMDLSSGASGAREARIRREAPSALLGNAMNFPGMELASAWGIKPLPSRFRAPVKSTVPVLIVVGDLDVRTPAANAREVARTLPNSHVVVVQNAAHEFSLFGNPALRQVLGLFIAGKPVEAATVTLRPLDFQR